MALMPKRVKYRKLQRGRTRGKATRGNRVSFGEFGLQSLQPGLLSGKQIEAGRVAASHFLGREGKLWIRIFPQKSMTATAAETRMGTGKGEPDYWAAAVKPGTILYELAGIPAEIAKQTFNRVAHKMPLRCRMVRRRHTI